MTPNPLQNESYMCDVMSGFQAEVAESGERLQDGDGGEEAHVQRAPGQGQEGCGRDRREQRKNSKTHGKLTEL